MDAIERIKDDLRKGRIDPERLVEVLEALQRALDAAKRRIAELEKQFGGAAATKVDEPFSMRAEEHRQEARGMRRRRRSRPQRRGRLTTAEKIRQAARIEKVFPRGVAESDCRWSHTRPVWRLENGRALLVAYQVYRGPKNQFGKIPGTLGRSEFGVEIVIAIAYQVYVVGLSFDKVCLLLNFFQNVRLRKSQADALLHQLSRHWSGETIILSVLESLRHHLASFTLTAVIDEITRWFQMGRSCFAEHAAQLGLPATPATAVLDRVLPRPSG